MQVEQELQHDESSSGPESAARAFALDYSVSPPPGAISSARRHWRPRLL
jgi:hypothetical protein